MYDLKLHPKIEDDLKELDKTLQIQVFKKLKQLQQSPQLGLPLGNKNNMNLSGFRKMYVAKKELELFMKFKMIFCVFTLLQLEKGMIWKFIKRLLRGCKTRQNYKLY